VSSAASFTGTMGMFAAGGTLYYATRADGNLNAIGLAAGATTGASRVVDGPATGGNDWRSRALFLSSTAAPANVPPTARFTVQCTQLTCSFDGSTSSDSDGSIASYAWTFGDGATGTGRTATHTYAAGGSYTASLVVTDNGGATGQVSHPAAPTGPVTGGHIAFDGSSSAAANSASPQVTLPAQAATGDLMILTATLNSATTATTPAGWSLLDQASTTGTTTYVWTRRATAADAGGRATVALAASTKSVLTVAAYSGVDATSPVAGHATGSDAGTSSHTSPTLTAPATSTIVTFWSDKSPNTSAWTPPAGVTQRVAAYSSGTGRVSALVADAAAPSDGHAGGLTATTDVASTRGISWTIALDPS
jgi:PKD repeat protein